MFRKYLSGRKLLIAAALGVTAMTFLLYLPALQNGFINLDDHLYVIENYKIRSLDIAFFKWAFTINYELANWHPLTFISLAVDYAVWELNPFGFHLTNNILHSINTGLILILTHMLVATGFKKLKNNDYERRFILTAAVVAAMLFGLHPLHVESVAWISERKDLLCALFYILSLIFYLKYRSAENGRAILYITSLAAFLLSILSKPMAVSLPLVLLILDYYPLRRFSSMGRGDLKRILLEKAPFAALSAFLAIITIFAQRGGGAVSTLGEFPLAVRLLVAARAIVFYIYKSFVPLRLIPAYQYPELVSIQSLEYAGAVLLVIAVSFLCFFLLRRRNLYKAAWVYFIITLLPVLGIMQVGGQPAADRYTYIPGIVLFILIGLAAALCIIGAAKKRAIIALLVTISVFFALAVMTVRQIGIWSDPITFSDYIIKINPKSDRAYTMRAKTHYGSGRYMEALADYNKSIEINPFVAEVRSDRGNIYFSLGKYEIALLEYLEAIRLDPDNGHAHYNAALVYKTTGRQREALGHFKRALALGVREAQDHL